MPREKLWALILIVNTTVAAVLSMCVATGRNFLGNDCFYAVTYDDENWLGYFVNCSGADYGRRNSVGPRLPCYHHADGEHSCDLSPENSFHKASAAFALMALIFSWALALVLWFMWDRRAYSRSRLRAIAVLLLFCFVFQSLVFLLFGSDFCDIGTSGCQLRAFGVLNAVACVMWPLSAFCSSKLVDFVESPAVVLDVEAVETAVPAAVSSGVQPTSATKSEGMRNGTRIATSRTETVTGSVVITTQTVSPDGEGQIEVAIDTLSTTK